MNKRISLILAAIILSACSGFQDEAVSKTREAADDAARALTIAPCAMTTGAYFRLDEQRRLAVAMLCGGDFMARLQGIVEGPD